MTCLDPDCLVARTYDFENAYKAYLAFVDDPTEDNRLEAWDQIIPLIPSKIHRLHRPHDKYEVDDVCGIMGWKLYADLPNVREKMEITSPLQYLMIMRGVLKYGFLRGISHLKKGSVHSIESDIGYEFDRMKTHRGEGSIRMLEEKLYLQDLPKVLHKWMSRQVEKRFVGPVRKHEVRKAVFYILRRAMVGRHAIKRVLKEVYHLKEPKFILDWTMVKIRTFLTGQRESYHWVGEGRIDEFVFAE